jgi:hypothetical protein
MQPLGAGGAVREYILRACLSLTADYDAGGKLPLLKEVSRARKGARPSPVELHLHLAKSG